MNTWDNLDDAQRRELCMKAIEGQPKTNENYQRAHQMLAQNPNMVDRMLKETGVGPDDMELSDTRPSSAEEGIDQAMEESAASDVQETGRVASDIPPAEDGESLDEYIYRLAKLKDGSGGRAVLSKA